ncbi:MAG: bifunctional DNA primase/polymerase [Tepidiformaceae bacterium]
MSAPPAADIVEAAYASAARGWPVFPCQPNGKAPLTSRGFKDATTDPATIRRWWGRWPDANLAVATGAPGPDVLDVDVKNDAPGLAMLERVRRAGLLGGASALMRTPSSGLHVYFHGTAQAGGAVGPGRALELKAAGGYVLVPPSYVIDEKHGIDGPYELLEERVSSAVLDWAAVRGLLDPPNPLPRRQAARSGSGDGLARWLAKQGVGNRNAALYWAACRAFDAGQPGGALVAAAVDAGLGAREAERTVASAYRCAGRVS